MPTRYIRRGAALTPGQTGLAAASPIYMDSDTNEIKYVPAASGSTEKTLVDLANTQTLTNKTLTAPVLTAPSITGGATLAGTVTGLLLPVTEYDGDGAIAIATGIVALISADAGAYTLAAPSAAQAGVVLIITSKTAAAHVITATNLINDGVGPTLDTITFDAQPGASIILVAYNLLWYVVSQNATTATAGA
jgi:hypothetical protein